MKASLREVLSAELQGRWDPDLIGVYVLDWLQELATIQMDLMLGDGEPSEAECCSVAHQAVDALVANLDKWSRPCGAWLIDETVEYVPHAYEDRQRQLSKGPYPEYLRSPEWRALRAAVVRRAEGRCQLCNCGGPLHVHHRTYERRGQERMADLVALCPSCHRKVHGK